MPIMNHKNLSEMDFSLNKKQVINYMLDEGIMFIVNDFFPTKQPVFSIDEIEKYWDFVRDKFLITYMSYNKI